MKKFRKITYQILPKSKDAMLLGIEIFNKPTVGYRIESFAIFYTNAWELLLKARIVELEKNPKAILKKKERNKIQESLSFPDCIKKVFTDETSPIRRNLEDVYELRNSASHLVIDELENIYSGLFQQGVLNYVKCLREWFNTEIEVTPRMLSLVFNFQPEKITTIKLRSRYSTDIQKFFDRHQSKIINNIGVLGGDYSVAIGTTLALVKKPRTADITLSTSPSAGKNIAIATVAKNYNETHPYKTGLVAKEITKRLKPEILNTLPKQEIRLYDVTCIKKALDLKPTSNGDYIFMVDAGSPNEYPQFSELFVDKMVSRITQEKDFLQKAQASAKKKNPSSEFVKKA